MTAPLPKHVNGARPSFHADPAIDRLIAMMLALTREVSVLRDRVDTLEILGAEAGWLTPDAVENYIAPLPVRQRREATREAMLGRVLSIMTQEITDLESGAGDYWGTISQIEKGEL